MPSPSVAWRTSSPTESAGIGRSGVAAPCRGRPRPAGLALALDLALRQLRQEPRRQVVPAGAEDRPRVRVRQREPLAGAGHPDVAEPPLLVLGVLLERALVREEPLLHADHEDDRELEPLGVVQRHQGDVRALGVERVLVGEERDLLQERVERGLLLAAFLVLARDPDELLEVLDPALRLERALGLEHVHVAARRERLLEQALRAQTRPPRPAGRRSAPRTRAPCPRAAAESETDAACSIASISDQPMSDACSASRSSVVWPMPRRGRFTIRRSDTSSAGLAITWR